MILKKHNTTFKQILNSYKNNNTKTKEKQVQEDSFYPRNDK